MADMSTQTDATPVEPTAGPQMSSPSQWRQWIEAAKKVRKEYLSDWKENVAYRVQKPFKGDPDSAMADRVAVPEDWSRTRQKTAQLAFQVPQVNLKAKHPQYEATAPVATRALNDKLTRECRFAYVLDECLADVVNAAGLMAVYVGVDQRFEEVEAPPLPGADPAEAPQKIRRKVYQRFFTRRISPSALLWPSEFTGSDWDEAPWLGVETYYPLEEARKLFNLPADFKPPECHPELMSDDILKPDEKTRDTTAYVKVQEIWYKAALYDADKVHPECLRRIIFVEGLEEPVFRGDTNWQKWIPEQPEEPPTPEVPAGIDPETGQPTPAQPAKPGKPAVPGHYIGLRKFPIRVGTLVYISDAAIPPSDSQAGRPQVRELIRSRSQMLQQRDHSIPLRWFDVNRVDEEIAEKLKIGEWQGFIPMNGPGTNAIGEVARASYPRENFQFAANIGQDLDRAWALSNNQIGVTNTGRRSASEVNLVASANDQRLAYEKSRVNRFVAEVAEVLYSLMQRFWDGVDYVHVIGDDGLERLTPVTESTLAGDFIFETRVDSSDRIDTDAKIQHGLRVLNLLGNSPTFRREAMEAEVIALMGFDPQKFTRQPEQKGPDPASISFRFSTEDMLNPMSVALLLKYGYDIGPQDIQAAAAMIKDAVATMAGLPMPSQQQPPQGLPPPSDGIPLQPGQPQPQLTPPSDAMMQPVLKRLDNGERMT